CRTTATGWEKVGGDLNTTGKTVRWCDAGVVTGQLSVVFPERTATPLGPTSLRVRKWVSGAWVDAGTGAAGYGRTRLAGTWLAETFTDGSLTVGGEAVSPTADAIALGIDGTTPVVAWTERDESAARTRLMVAAREGSGVITRPPLTRWTGGGDKT